MNDTVEVRTAGDPTDAIVAATEGLAGTGGIYRVTIAHDDDCPCVKGRSLPSCTCEIVRVTRERLA